MFRMCCGVAWFRASWATMAWACRRVRVLWAEGRVEWAEGRGEWTEGRAPLRVELVDPAGKTSSPAKKNLFKRPNLYFTMSI